MRRIPEFLLKPWFIVLFVIGLLGVVVAFSINQIMNTLLHTRAEVVVPKLEGKSILDALAIVSPLDLSIQQESTDFDEGLPAGTIIRQVPPAGMHVRAGRAIRVIVSKGGQVVFVPDITGKPLAEAQSVLAANGMQIGAVSEMFSIDTTKNVVITQTPSSGTVATRGALVDVEVSKGLPPAGLPLVPDFMGKSLKEAQGWADGVKASVDFKEDPKAVGVAGTVIKQMPLPGQPLMEGQDLKLTIAGRSGQGGSTRFSYTVPSDIGSSEVTVRIMARDSEGENQVYEGKNKPGATVEIPIKITSTTRFRVYVDDDLKDESVIEP